MKGRTDQMLLAGFLLSLATYAAIAYIDLTGTYSGLTNPSRFEIWFLYRFLVWMTVGFHSVPLFCFQLLLCRRARHWIAAIPALVITGAALWFAYGFCTATGWDALGWGICLVLSAAPAVGCILAWAVYGLWRLYQRGDIHAP